MLLIDKAKDDYKKAWFYVSEIIENGWSRQPLAISEYELEKFFPEKVEGTIPTIEEIEAKLSARLEA